MKKFALQDKKLLLLATSIALLVLLMPHGAVLAIGEGVAEDVFAWIVTLLLQIVGAVTYLGGTILNFVVKISIVDMKQWVEAAGIDNAWKVIRDVSNMGFIFILLYAAIMTILGKGSDNKRLIVNVVLAAVLMNFSLFFTKLFIDATNLVALLFYGQMVPASELVRGSVFTNQGLASTIMESIKIQSIWSGAAGDGVTITQIMLVGVLGSIVSLVAAFVFFAIAIMFVVRFVALLIVMVLSPLAFLAFALPQAEKYRKQWWDALSGQALFAPIYFLLTWVVISIAQSLAHNPVIQGVDPTDWAASLGGVAEKVTSADGTVSLVTKSNPQSTGIIVNFGIIIALLIASLTIAKEWANKAGGTATKLTKWATGVAGGATLGMAGRAGRNTFGRVGAAIGESETLKDAASKGGAKGMAARLSLAAGRKTSKTSFDLRGSPLGGAIDGGKAQKGGFEQILKDKKKKEADFAKSLGPSDALITDAERDLEKIKADKKTVENIDVTSQDFIREHREVKDRQGEAVRAKREKLQELERLSATGANVDPQDIAIAQNELYNEQDKLVRIDNVEEYKLQKEKDADDNVRKAQGRVDELKGVNEDEAKKRLKKEGWTDKQLESAQGRAAIENMKVEGLGEQRKKTRIETLENSPTQKVARLAEKPARYVAEGIRSGGEVLGAMAEQATRNAESRGDRTGRVLGTVGRVAEQYVRGTTGLVSEVIGGSPNLIRMKNRAAVAEIRKGKKSVKDRLEEILKEEGEVKKKEGGDAGGGGSTPSGGTPPPPPGGAPTP